MLGFLGPLALWPAAVLHVALPVMVARHVRGAGRERFLREDAPRIAEGLEWLLGVHAWAAMVVAHAPWHPGPREARLRIALAARAPGAGRALGRLATGLPGAIAQVLVGAAGLVPWLVAAAVVLAGARQPERLWRLQARLLARHARLLARQALIADGSRAGARPRTGACRGTVPR